MRLFDHQSGAYLQTAGANIYYEVAGQQDGPALLVLHGGFGHLENFNPILASLKQAFRVIGIDSRGQGKSTLGSIALTYEQLQHDIETVLDHLSITTVSIMGFSDGGIVAYRLAALTSLHIEKLVTIGSRWHAKNIESARALLSSVTGESWRTKFPDTYAAYQTLNPEPDFDVLAQSLVRMWLDSNPSGYPNEAVTNIACPVLIVRGDDDHLISRATVFELAELVKNARLLNIPFAGHAAFEEQPEIFMISLNEFFST